MESILKSDIFFFISTIALVLISAGVLIALGYAVKILRNVKDISERIREEGTEMIADVKNLRKSLRDEGLKWKHVADLARNFFVRKGKKAQKIAEKIIIK